MNIFNSIPLSQIPFPVIVTNVTNVTNVSNAILAINQAAKTIFSLDKNSKGQAIEHYFSGYTPSKVISVEALKSGLLSPVITMEKNDSVASGFEVVVVKAQEYFILFFKTLSSPQLKLSEVLNQSNDINKAHGTKTIETEVGVQLSTLEITYQRIARDFNGVLGNAVGALKLMETRSGQKDKTTTGTNIKSLRKVVDKGKLLTKGLENKIPATEAHAQCFCPDKVIRANIEILRRVCDSRVSLVISSEQRNLKIKFPHMEFINILKGMVENASEAIEGILEQEPDYQGRIEVSTFENDDGKCEVIISDNGGGIKVKDASVLFTPLYSTKVSSIAIQNLQSPLKTTPNYSSDKIKGLSLALVYRALKRHEAYIGVDTQNMEGGATFTLSFHSVHVNSVASVKRAIAQVNAEQKEKYLA